MRDQKLKMEDFRRPSPNMGDQKSPKLPLYLTVYIHVYYVHVYIMYMYILCVVHGGVLQ